MGGPQGLKEYKRSRERQQTAGIGGGVGGLAMCNSLHPVQLMELELDDTVMQVCDSHMMLM